MILVCVCLCVVVVQIFFTSSPLSLAAFFCYRGHAYMALGMFENETDRLILFVCVCVCVLPRLYVSDVKNDFAL